MPLPSPARAWRALTPRLDATGDALGPLFLRLLLAWEFWEAGITKLQGQNWFARVQGDFPLPFNLLPADLSWGFATWTELLGAIALALGLGTRLVASALFVLTVVAIAAVHWPDDWASLAQLWQGYAIRDTGFGNFKLPLLFLAMLLPLALRGGGTLSLDAALARLGPPTGAPRHDALGWGLVALVFGASTAMLLPLAGSAIVLAAVVLLALAWRQALA